MKNTIDVTICMSEDEGDGGNVNLHTADSKYNKKTKKETASSCLKTGSGQTISSRTLDRQAGNQ